LNQQAFRFSAFVGVSLAAALALQVAWGVMPMQTQSFFHQVWFVYNFVIPALAAFVISWGFRTGLGSHGVDAVWQISAGLFCFAVPFFAMLLDLEFRCGILRTKCVLL
jgi:hypothetical protein